MKNAPFILFIPALLFAQEFQFQLEPDSIPVIISNWHPFQPWIGSETEVDADFCDIDADGDRNLFIGEGFRNFWYDRNDGHSVNFSFTHVSDFHGGNLGGQLCLGRVRRQTYW